MKKPIVAETKKQRQFSDIATKLESLGDKLDDLYTLVSQQGELLKRLVPNETKPPLPSEVVASAFGREACANRLLRSSPANVPSIDKNLSSL